MMNYEIVDNIFTGELPDGDLTHDEDEFFDAWGDELADYVCEFEEDWI